MIPSNKLQHLANREEEIIYEYWKDDATSLIDGVSHISNGLPVGNLTEYKSDEPVPKRRKANSSHALPLKSTPGKGSNFPSQVSKSDTETPSAVAGRSSEPQSARLVNAEDRKAVGAPSQLPIVNHARESLSSTSLNPTNTHGVDEQRRTGEIVSDTARLERTGISTISGLLNHDSDIAAFAPAAMQGPLAGSDDQQSDTTRAGVGTHLLSK